MSTLLLLRHLTSIAQCVFACIFLSFCRDQLRQSHRGLWQLQAFFLWSQLSIWITIQSYLNIAIKTIWLPELKSGTQITKQLNSWQWMSVLSFKLSNCHFNYQTHLRVPSLCSLSVLFSFGKKSVYAIVAITLSLDLIFKFQWNSC